MAKMVFDDDYDGPRWTYGLLFRPLGFAQVPDGWIIQSDRKHKDFSNHGTVDYPRELTDREVESFQLTFLSRTQGKGLKETEPLKETRRPSKSGLGRKRGL